MAPVFSADARLGRWFVQQRYRVNVNAERIVARYQRRMKELEPTPHMETRGLPQDFRRDSSDGYGQRSEW